MKIANLVEWSATSHDYHRAWLPFSLLDQYGIYVDINPHPTKLREYDIINNFCTHSQFVYWPYIERLESVVKCAHIGDDVWSFRGKYLDRYTLKDINSTLRKHHVGIVPTSHLASRVSRIVRPVYVMPNCVNLGVYKKAKRSSDRLRIVYMGSPTHLSDFSSIVFPLLRVFREFPNVDLYVFGFEPKQLYAYKEFYGRVGYSRFVDFSLYFQVLSRMSPDIALIPLTAQKFNLSKTNLKFLEMAALNVAVVVSDHPVFSDVSKHGSNCLVASSQDDWYKHIAALIQSDVLRETLAKNAYNFVKYNYSVQHMSDYYADLFFEIYERFNV